MSNIPVWFLCTLFCTTLSSYTDAFPQHTDCSNPIDVAVIGGGIGGAYAAWKLKESKQSIYLFEYSNRIGGRVYSRKLPGIDYRMAEIGAMRFIPMIETNAGTMGHVFVSKAIASLNLTIMDFQDYRGDYKSNLQNNIWYLRGTHMKYNDLGSSKVPYKMYQDELGKAPSQLRRKIYEASVPNPASSVDFNPVDEEDKDGVDLFRQRYDRIWHKYGGSNEALEYVTDAMGIDLSHMNAAFAVPASPQGVFDEMRFKTLKGGMSTLPTTMANQFEDSSPERHQVHMNHKLVRIEGRGQNQLLSFQITTTRNYITSDTREQATVCAKRVILALPRDALMDIDWQPLHGNVFIENGLNAVRGIEAFRMYLGYENPWWENLGITTGRSITTLPVRQMIYMGQEKPSTGIVQDLNRKSMMLVYPVQPQASFWDDSTLNSHLAVNPLADNMLTSEYNISETILSEAQNQLAEVHQLRREDLARPYTGVMHYWKHGGPQGPAFYAWRAGYNWEIISKLMIKPFADENVHIVGSCYSGKQAWMEGALDSVEELLDEHYNQHEDKWIENNSIIRRRRSVHSRAQGGIADMSVDTFSDGYYNRESPTTSSSPVQLVLSNVIFMVSALCMLH
ncbi:unnamed protein product [Owenia fusiformis]|uniref:Amine oxidase domain-containing protein n=1 Tax=Owenia fusiformis TaxID=6347 RepID=A0A8S4N3R9_OWEFU|nr:unnamed protein product [Owenia fusiformis]